jgi:hypothetical protein
MQQYFNRSYNFSLSSPSRPVMALNSVSNKWVRTTLGDVQVYSAYDLFYFVDDQVADQDEEDEIPEPESHIQMAKNVVNQMLDWIDMWSMKAPAVTNKLNEFRDEIFEHLDEAEVEMYSDGIPG